jgi:hypothetical protein
MAAIRPTEERYLAYLAKAEDARLVAHDRYDPNAREAWGQIADEWQYLADQLLRLDKI